MSLPRLPLLARLIATLAAVAILPFAIGFYQLRSNKDNLLDQVLRTHIVATSSAAARVSSHVGALAGLAAALAQNPVVAGDPRSPGSQELLSATLQTSPAIAAVGIYDPAGEPAVVVQRSDQRDEIAPALLPTDPRPTAVVAGKNRRWLRLRRPLAGDAGSLVLLAEAEPLAAMVAPEELGEEAELLLVDPAGRAVFGDPEALAAFPAAIREQAATGKLGSGAAKLSVPGQEEAIVAHYQVAGTPWLVLSRQSSRVAEVAQRGIRRATWLAVLATLLIASLLTTAAHFTVVRPLRRLALAQQNLAGIETHAPAGGSEIDQLEAGFASLEQRLRDSEELGRVFLGRYQVLELAGSGSMGTVFRGWDPRLQRPVALKTIRLDAASFDREKLARRLQSEAVTSARFNHPNIVTVYDMLHTGSSACIAMEFVDGTTLESYLHQHGALAAEQLIPLGAALARALAAAHEHGLVHHDVKPANVLLGRDGTIKVTDFGISQLVTSAAVAQDVVCGTPGYLPPESLRGQGYSPQSDLFSLGVVLYECLDGRHPFAGSNLREMMIQTLSRDPQPIGERRPELPAELAQLVTQLLDKDPARRPPGAPAVAERLEALALVRAAGWRFEPAPAAERKSRGLTSVPTLLVSHAGGSPKLAAELPPRRAPELK